MAHGVLLELSKAAWRMVGPTPARANRVIVAVAAMANPNARYFRFARNIAKSRQGKIFMEAATAQRIADVNIRFRMYATRPRRTNTQITASMLPRSMRNASG